jgi:phosphatidylserine/phosphatidylglycerophosphate/cardiolipin synthase-like enzyme
VFAAALSLALGVLLPVVPAASVTPGVAVAVCFEPEEDCTAFVIEAIDRAETLILVNADTLTTSSGIVEALVRAKRRGVDVKLIADKTTPPVSGAAGLIPWLVPGCLSGSIEAFGSPMARAWSSMIKLPWSAR